jgi:hypothetical protein
LEFLNRDYTKKYVVADIDQYHISNVVKLFFELIEKINDKKNNS